MQKIIFKINSIKEEKQVFKLVRDNLEFLKKERLIFTWPEKSIEEEYDKKLLEEAKKKIEQEWKQKENNFFRKIELFFNIKIKKPFIVKISNYGTLGSYNNLERKVTINKNHKNKDIVETIKHEIIHIIIEPYIQKLKIDHSRKEYIVNSIYEIISNSK